MNRHFFILFTVAILLLVSCQEEASQGRGATTQPDTRQDTDIASDTGLPHDTASMDTAMDTAQQDVAIDTTRDTTDMAMPPQSGGQAAHCAGLSESLRISTAGGTEILVSPTGSGRVEVDGATMTLRQAVNMASEGDTILLADGIYELPEADPGSYSGLYFTTPNVTMRSQSGDATAVVLNSDYADHGGSTAAITISAPSITLLDFTVQRSIFHLIHFSGGDGDGAVVHNVRMIDGGQQFLKSSSGGDAIDGVLVSCSLFMMTPEGRDHVWGYGPSDGGTRCYTGGIDTHEATNWVVSDNRFEGIYCNPDGVPRPAHGKKGNNRNNMTYTGGLAEHAIHMWDSVQGTGHRIERNHIINCARGVGIGLVAEVYGTTVQNNMIVSEFAGSGEHDVGIIIERAHDTRVVHNTVIGTHPDSYRNSIEYRWESTSQVTISNNLTSHLIRSRNNASATLEGNLENADPGWFDNPSSGALHLADCTNGAVVGQGVSRPEVADDIDLEPRASPPDLGADQCHSPQ